MRFVGRAPGPVGQIAEPPDSSGAFKTFGTTFFVRKSGIFERSKVAQRGREHVVAAKPINGGRRATYGAAGGEEHDHGLGIVCKRRCGDQAVFVIVIGQAPLEKNTPGYAVIFTAPRVERNARMAASLKKEGFQGIPKGCLKTAFERKAKRPRL
jgi:hypothetical protein